MAEEHQDVRYHIIYLTNQQQVTIRTVVFDYCSRRSWEILATIVPQSPEDWNIISETVHRDMVRVMRRYENITACLASIDSYPQRKGRIYYFDEEGMKWIRDALESYNTDATHADSDQMQMTRRNLETTKKRVNESAKYMYTQEEVKKALDEEKERK